MSAWGSCSYGGLGAGKGVLIELQKLTGFLSALVLTLMLAVPVFAASPVPQVDWSTELTGSLDGAAIVAGLVAAIAAVFLVAIAVRLTFKTARLTLKALGFIK